MTSLKQNADSSVPVRSNARFVWKRATGLVLLAGALTLPSIQPSYAAPVHDEKQDQDDRGRRPRDGDRRDAQERGPRDRGPGDRADGDRRPGDRGPGERGPGDRGPGERGPGDRGPGDRGGAGPEEMMRRMPIIAALDANHDGKISKEEIDNASVALRKLDKNSDGALTFDELRPQGDFAGRPRDGGDRERGPGRGEGGGDMPREAMENPQQFARMLFERRDANSDNKLTGDEIPEPMRARMEGIDTDNDDAISREELTTAMRRFGEAGRGGGRENMRGDRGRDAEEGGKTPKRPRAESDAE